MVHINAEAWLATDGVYSSPCLLRMVNSTNYSLCKKYCDDKIHVELGILRLFVQ